LLNNNNNNKWLTALHPGKAGESLQEKTFTHSLPICIVIIQSYLLKIVATNNNSNNNEEKINEKPAVRGSPNHAIL